MSVKIKLLRGAAIATKAIGLDGAPYKAAEGTEIELSDEGFEVFQKCYAPESYEVVSASKAKAKAKAKGD